MNHSTECARFPKEFSLHMGCHGCNLTNLLHAVLGQHWDWDWTKAQHKQRSILDLLS